MTFLSLLAPVLLAQVGPLVTPGAAPPIPGVPGMDHTQRPRPAQPAPVAPAEAEPSQLQACLLEARQAPETGIELASAWLATAQGTARVEPALCLGTAHSRFENWPAAEQAFLAGRDAVAAPDKALRARLGTMAGNAALVQGEPARALATLDAAHDDALAGGDPALGGEIAIDRARALVALGRPEDAAAALAEARTAAPANAYGWLLSATLSRRMNKLAEAQAQIEEAARLLPIDAEIGLEAGVIAVLLGHDEAARRSWKSVLAAAPGTELATRAQGYIDQLGPEPAPDPAAPAAGPAPTPAPAEAPGR